MPFVNYIRDFCNLMIEHKYILFRENLDLLVFVNELLETTELLNKL